MASTSSSRKSTRSKPLKERRAPTGADPGSLSKLKGLLVRPIGLQRRDGKLHVVLTARRRVRPADEAPSMALLCAELSARMLAHAPDEAVRTMRHLILVHDSLEHRGWSAIEAMSSLVLMKALEQVQALAAEEPSPHLDMLVEALNPLLAAARLREQREARSMKFAPVDQPEVGESNYAEFEDAEQHWTTPPTVPAELMPRDGPGRDD
jgi:hypothetical protein